MATVCVRLVKDADDLKTQTELSPPVKIAIKTGDNYDIKDSNEMNADDFVKDSMYAQVDAPAIVPDGDVVSVSVADADADVVSVANADDADADVVSVANANADDGDGDDGTVVSVVSVGDGDDGDDGDDDGDGGDGVSADTTVSTGTLAGTSGGGKRRKSSKKGRKSTRKGRKSAKKCRKSVKRGRKGKGSRRSKK
tara:strand:- start:1702 stop:2289 length:588 start_codon:yes stop_codon:yes gene_type:complete